MTVVLVTDISGLTVRWSRQAIDQFGSQLKAAPGLLSHAGTATAQGFRIIEIRQSQGACQSC